MRLPESLTDYPVIFANKLMNAQNAGFPTDLPAPAALSTADANDGDALTSAFGEYVTRCMYSKNWQHRSAVFKFLSEQVRNGSLKDHKLLIKHLQKGLQEKVAALVLDCVALVRVAIPRGGKLVAHLMQGLLPLMLDRLGDGNARIAVSIYVLYDVSYLHNSVLTVPCSFAIL